MRTISRKLFGALGLAVALSAVAEPSSGYKGIPWGAPCTEAPVRSSQDYAGQDPPPIRYLILAQAEDRALKKASVACARKRLAEKRLEKQRLADGNRAAVR